MTRALADYLASPEDDGPEIVICTHQALFRLPFMVTGSDWHLLIDECPQNHREATHNLPNTHELITKYISLKQYNNTYALVTVDDQEALKRIAYNKEGDDILAVLQETARLLIDPHWQTFVLRQSYEQLVDGSSEQLTFHSVLPSTVLDPFRSVFVCGANFEDSGVYKLWRPEVDWRRDQPFEASLRYASHENGSLLNIYYAMEGNWSRAKRQECNEDISNLVRIRDAAIELFQGRSFVWQANKPVPDSFFGDKGTRLPNSPHGLNDYSKIHDVVFLSALNPTPAHCAFLQDRAVDPDEIAAMQYLETVYQSVMRTSLRDPTDTHPKTVIVPDRRAAEYLAQKIPGATVLKLETGIVEEIRKSGRPRKHENDAEKSRIWRQKKRLKKKYVKHLLDSLPAQDQTGIGCGKDKRHESTISITSDFVSDMPCWGTLYEKRYHKDEIGYLVGSTRDFIDFLKQCSEQSVHSKESVPLFSPATFDPAKAEETNRGLANIVSIRNIVLDFENGDLRPETFPDFFPELEMVITNSYNHTNEEPRFRVIIIIDRPLSVDAYEAIWDEIEARLKDAGYLREPSKRSKYGRSGLDWTKRTPASLFHLPSQAEKSADSFFSVCSGTGRKPLDAAQWVSTARIQALPEYELVEAPNVQSSLPAEDEKVQAAIQQWRSAPPGRGNREFFMLFIRLRDLGMEDWQIEAVLKAEAAGSRSPDERRRQITSIMTSLGKRKYAGADFC